MLTLLVVLLLGEAVVDRADGGPSDECLMKPRHRLMRVPSRGIAWLEGENQDGPCETVPAKAWMTRPSEGIDILVHAGGPSGSGRYWTITVALARKHEKIPTRGFCLETSTLGWRTLQQFHKAPLPWIDDWDGDGRPELMLWDSFSVDPEFSMSGAGLVAWVYELDAKDNFVINWPKTRKIASELAASYRTPLARDQAERLQGLRNEAAQALTAFAAGACTIPGAGASQR